MQMASATSATGSPPSSRLAATCMPSRQLSQVTTPAHRSALPGCDGSDMEREISDVKGFGDPENRDAYALVVHDAKMHAFTLNLTDGMEIWQTGNGTHGRKSSRMAWATVTMWPPIGITQ